MVHKLWTTDLHPLTPPVNHFILKIIICNRCWLPTNFSNSIFILSSSNRLGTQITFISKSQVNITSNFNILRLKSELLLLLQITDWMVPPGLAAPLKQKNSILCLKKREWYPCALDSSRITQLLIFVNRTNSESV